MPPRVLEAAVAMALPVAVREQVLGDLCERYQSPGQYVVEAMRVVPAVVWGRIRRTADWQLTLLLALMSYLCYLSAAWFVPEPGLGLWRLARPVAVTLLGMVLADVYARRPGAGWGPAVGTLLVFVAEVALPARILLPAALATWVLAWTARRFLRQETPRWQAAGGTTQRPAMLPDAMVDGGNRFLIAVVIVVLVNILRKWGLGL